MREEDMKQIIQEAYEKIAQGSKNCGCDMAKEYLKTVGYSEEDMLKNAEDTDCANPTALANLKKGEVVLDFGYGYDLDCLLCEDKIGLSLKVIGDDMTPEPLSSVIGIARDNTPHNVELQIDMIESLPIEDNSVDVIVSNNVINLSADKELLFHEAYRVLNAEGRIAISDIALKKPLPGELQQQIDADINYVSGMVLIDEYAQLLENAGFKDVSVTLKSISSNDPNAKEITDKFKDRKTLRDYVIGIFVEGHK